MLRDLQGEEKIEQEIKIASEPWRMFLRDCAELLRTKGWCVVQFRDDEGRHCSLGAMYEVSQSYHHHRAAFSEAVSKFREFIGVPQGSIAIWNDDQTDVAPVIAAFEGAALS